MTTSARSCRYAIRPPLHHGAWPSRLPPSELNAQCFRIERPTQRGVRHCPRAPTRSGMHILPVMSHLDGTVTLQKSDFGAGVAAHRAGIASESAANMPWRQRRRISGARAKVSNSPERWCRLSSRDSDDCQPILVPSSCPTAGTTPPPKMPFRVLQSGIPARLKSFHHAKSGLAQMQRSSSSHRLAELRARPSPMQHARC